MKRFIFSFVGAVASLFTMCNANAQIRGDYYYWADGGKVPLVLFTGEIAVQSTEGATEKEVEDLVKGETYLMPYSEAGRLPNPPLTFLKLRKGASEERIFEIIDRLNRRGEVKFAAPIFKYKKTRLILTDEFIAQFKPSATETEIREFNQANGVELVKKTEWVDNNYVLRITKGSDKNALEMANLYYESPLAEYAHPNFVSQLERMSTTPNDTHFPNQWALNNTGQYGGSPNADIDAPEAWDISTGSSDITIAIIDEGVDVTHEDLASKLVTGYDATDGDDDQQPNSWDGHGTACAGIAAAVSNNNLGIAGVAWNCKIIPVRVAYSVHSDSQSTTEYTWLANGIAIAALRGADVLSNSWTVGPPSDFVTSAIRYARSNGRGGKGCVIAFSSGNDNSSVDYPATLPEVIAVGATNQNDERCTPDDWGSGKGSNYGPELDVIAPGNHIWITDIMGSGGYDSGNYYEYFSGTSAAAPHVAGLAALILSANPELTSDEVQTTIQNTADDQVGDPSEDTPGWDQYMGYGRVNAFNALGPMRYIPVSGHITENTTWHFDNVYMITGDLYVDAGVTLTIEAGTVVKFEYRSSSSDKLVLTVNGILDVQGTETNRVIFTSSRDDSEGGDSNGDEDLTSPSPGDWGYIRINYWKNVLDWCLIKYGGIRTSGSSSYHYVVWCNGCAPTVTNNVLSYIYDAHNYPVIYCTYSGGTPVIINNSISGRAWGVRCDYSGTSPAVVSKPIISGNSTSLGHGDYGIYCKNTSSGLFAPQITGNNLGGWEPGTGIYIENTQSSALLSDNTITKFDSSIYCKNDSGLIQYNTLSDFDYGIYVYSGLPLIVNNVITGDTTVYGVYNRSTSETVDARLNWWGHESGPYDPSTGPPDYNPNGLGPRVTDYVYYRPWIGEYGTVNVADSRTGVPGTDCAPISIVLDNGMDIAGVETHLKYDPTYLSICDVLLTDRTSDFDNLSWNESTPGSLTILLFDTGGDKIAPGIRPIMNVRFNVSVDAPCCDSTFIHLDEVIISDSAGTSISARLGDGWFHYGKKGDVNCDDNINILDIIGLVNCILYQENCNACADWNSDGRVDILDIIGVVNCILYGDCEPGKGSLAKVTVPEPAQVGIADISQSSSNLITVPIGIETSVPVAGLQLTLDYDSERLVPGEVQATELTDGLTIASKVESGKLTLLLYSTSGGLIPAGSGPVVEISFKLISKKAGGGRLHFNEVILAGENGEAIPVITKDAVLPAPLPKTYTLSQNYPNPFNPITEIKYSLQKDCNVTLTIYNTLGQKVATLVDSYQRAGYKTARWEAGSFSSGIYFYRLQAGDFVQTRKMVLIR